MFIVSQYVRYVKQTENPLATRLGQLDFELTERCNNNCIHCCINLPENDADAKHRELTTAQVQDILKQAADLGFQQVRFTGGEPLLRHDFEELYLFTRRLGLKALLYTNARLITPPMADLFARIPPLTEIEVTVYGMHKESYEAVTRWPGSFAQFWHGINLLLTRRVPFIVKGALLPQNRHEINEFENWAKTIPRMTRRPAYSTLFDFRERRVDEAKNRLIESLRLSPQDVVSVLMRDENCHKEIAKFASTFMVPSGDHLFKCGACDGGSVCMDAYGRAQPCMGIRSPGLTCDVVGANGRTSMQDALDQFTHLRDLRATNPNYLQRCARCFLNGLCEQCPAKSWTEHGTLDTPVQYLCDVAHAMARKLGLLGEKECGWESHDWRTRIKPVAS